MENGTKTNQIDWPNQLGNGWTWMQDMAIGIIVFLLMTYAHELGHLSVFWLLSGQWGYITMDFVVVLANYPLVPLASRLEYSLCSFGGLLLIWPFLLLWNKVGWNTRVIICVQIGYAILEGILGVFF